MNPSKHVKSLIDAVKKIEKAIDKQNMCINETDCYVKYCKNIQSQITKLINSGNNTKLVALLNSRLKFMNIRFIHKLQERRRRQQLQNEQPSNEIRIIENSKISELASDNNCVVNDAEDDQAGMNNEISELDNDNSNCAVIGHGIENDGQADDQIDNIGSIQQQQHEPLEWRDSMSAFATSIKEGIIDNTTYKDVRLFLKECLKVLKPVIQGLLKKNNLKVYCVLKNEFELKKEQDKLIKEPKWFNTKAYPIFETTDLDDWFNVHIIEKIENDIDMFIENGSGWRILRIIELSIFISKYLPFKGGGGTYIEIPQQILNTKACINVRNEDNLCFVWSILSAKLDIKKNAQRVNQYKRHLNTLNLNGLTFPLEPKQALANILALNKLSNNGYPEVVKAINLEENVNHKITNVKIVDTKYGQKIVIDLSYNDKDDVCFYLSSKMANALLKDVELLDHMNKYANEGKLFCKHLGKGIINFVTNENIQ
uniref:Uncharacterized protein n=1 Tax=Trichogramma kaykai TaxID=54128 RepID=A0ABD2XSA7_9HYME